MTTQPPETPNDLLRSFACAGRGIRTAAQGRNFKIECLIGLVAFILCWTFKVTGTEFLIVILFTVLVLGAECANTAMEAAVDLASPQYSELAMKAKDCAAGAVLLLSIGAAFTACVIFVPHIVAVFAG